MNYFIPAATIALGVAWQTRHRPKPTQRLPEVFSWWEDNAQGMYDDYVESQLRRLLRDQ